MSPTHDDQGNDNTSQTMQPNQTEAQPADSQLAPDPALHDQTTMREHRGIVMVLTGDGKGKSTSAYGAITRALGWGQSVGVVQFIKGEWQTGEQRFFASQPNVEWHISGAQFDWSDEAKEQSAQAAMEAFAQAASMMVTGEYDLIVLDEVNWAMHQGDLDAAAVLHAIAARDKSCTVILTGRNAPDLILDAADLITDMADTRHPHRQGMAAMRGVDY